jgi:preprotein translocase YajC subunit
MENGWILAEAQPAGPNNTEVIKAEDISSQGRQVTQTTTQQAEPNVGKQPPQNQWQSKNQWQSMIFIVMLFILLYFVMFRAPRKKQQQQEQMIKSLRKNDRVQTAGGILGTVLEVSDSEITLKVDESNNTKIKVLPSAISRVIEQK